MEGVQGFAQLADALGGGGMMNEEPTSCLPGFSQVTAVIDQDAVGAAELLLVTLALNRNTMILEVSDKDSLRGAIIQNPTKVQTSIKTKIALVLWLNPTLRLNMIELYLSVLLCVICHPLRGTSSTAKDRHMRSQPLMTPLLLADVKSY